MHKSLVAALSAALAVGYLGAAHAADQPGAKPADAGALFTQLDVDRDNAVSKGESQQHKDLSANFDKYDTNRDGKLDANEFAAAMAAMPKK